MTTHTHIDIHINQQHVSSTTSYTPAIQPPLLSHIHGSYSTHEIKLAHKIHKGQANQLTALPALTMIQKLSRNRSCSSTRWWPHNPYAEEKTNTRVGSVELFKFPVRFGYRGKTVVSVQYWFWVTCKKTIFGHGLLTWRDIMISMKSLPNPNKSLLPTKYSFK